MIRLLRAFLVRRPSVAASERRGWSNVFRDAIDVAKQRHPFRQWRQIVNFNVLRVEVFNVLRDHARKIRHDRAHLRKVLDLDFVMLEPA